MIPRARLLSDAFWWGRHLERFYQTHRLLSSTMHLDWQTAPSQPGISELGWGLLCTGQWEAFHCRSVALNQSTLWHWWIDSEEPHSLPALYQQLRHGLRAMRGDFRAEWFEHWNRYQSAFNMPKGESACLEHPVVQAVSQLYPMMLGMLEMEQGHTLLTHWVRFGVEWERLDMTLRLAILTVRYPDVQELPRLLEWVRGVQNVSVRTVPSVQDWISNRNLVRSIPWLYARLFDCMAEDSLLGRLVLPVQPMRTELSTLLNYQERLCSVVEALEANVGARAEYGV